MSAVDKVLQAGLLALGWLVLGTSAACAGGDPDGASVMRGLYLYLADAAVFTECQTGSRYPVAMEGDSLALEQAYLKARRLPAEALLVTLEGRIVERMPMEGPGPVPMLFPQKFLAVSPGETCALPGR